jgi:hypothetical protein
MASLKPLDATNQFDDRIRDRIESIRQSDRCDWCKDTRHPIQNKTMKLCSSCYRWHRIQQKLEMEVRQLPPERTRDPHFEKRLELDVAREAIKLCKGDGNVREYRLNQVEAIDLEHMFDGLSRKILGRQRGSNLFHGKTEDFFLFSPAQRIWIWHLLFNILSEKNKRERGHRAFIQDMQRKNREARSK